MSDLIGQHVRVRSVSETGRFAGAIGVVEQDSSYTFALDGPGLVVRFDEPVFGWVCHAEFRLEELEVTA